MDARHWLTTGAGRQNSPHHHDGGARACMCCHRRPISTVSTACPHRSSAGVCIDAGEQFDASVPDGGIDGADLRRRSCAGCTERAAMRCIVNAAAGRCAGPIAPKRQRRWMQQSHSAKLLARRWLTCWRRADGAYGNGPRRVRRLSPAYASVILIRLLQRSWPRREVCRRWATLATTRCRYVAISPKSGRRKAIEHAALQNFVLLPTLWCVYVAESTRRADRASARGAVAHPSQAAAGSCPGLPWHESPRSSNSGCVLAVCERQRATASALGC